MESGRRRARCQALGRLACGKRPQQQERILKGVDGTVVGSFGRSGRYTGQFHWVHNIAVDSHGTVFTTEVDTAKRAQKFRPAP